MNIAENLQRLKKSIPDHVSIVSVSKQQPVALLMEAYQAGQRVFGENKAQELALKQFQLPNDIAWHFIGHLQTNKVRQLAPFISLIHSIDRLSLLTEVNKEAAKNSRVIDCLLQFHIATEETKFGMNIEEARVLLESDGYHACANIRITGVMGMSSFSDNTDLVRKEFQCLHDYFLTLKRLFFNQQRSFEVISMGMSGDYQIAIEEGSTMVRIGTAIFGERKY